jgi:hypothetical protein
MNTDDERTIYERAPYLAGARDFLGLCLVAAACVVWWAVLG